MLKTVLNSTAKWSLTVCYLLLVSCSTTKQTSRSLITDYIGVQNWRVSDTLDLYYFPPLRTCAGNGRSDLITSDNKRPLQPHARIVRHTAANVTDTTHYQINEQKQVTTAKQPPAPMIDTGRKIIISVIIFLGFVFITSLILVILTLLRLTGSQ